MLTLAPKIGSTFTTINLGVDPTRTFTAFDDPSVYAPVFSLFAVIMAGGATFAILTKMGIIQILIDKGKEKSGTTSTSTSGPSSSNTNTSTTGGSSTSSSSGKGGKGGKSGKSGTSSGKAL